MLTIVPQTVHRKFVIIIPNYIPKLIRHIRRDHNLGLVPNYITSIQEANGRFIADCAGDDFWICPSKLQQQYDILSKNSKISLVHTAWQYFNPSKNTTSPSQTLSGKYSNYFCKETCGKDLIVPIVAHKVKPLIHLCTAMYRRDIVIKAINTYPDLFRSPWLTCEDIQITTVLAACGNIAYLPEITLNYTVTPNTASNQQLPQTAFSFYYGIILLTKLLQKNIQHTVQRSGLLLPKLHTASGKTHVQRQRAQTALQNQGANQPLQYNNIGTNKTLFSSINKQSALEHNMAVKTTCKTTQKMALACNIVTIVVPVFNRSNLVLRHSTALPAKPLCQA